VATTAPNQRWAMDFMHDLLSTRQAGRVFTVIDLHTRECIALEAGRSFTGTSRGC